jgi:hypothetical protein
MRSTGGIVTVMAHVTSSEKIFRVLELPSPKMHNLRWPMEIICSVAKLSSESCTGSICITNGTETAGRRKGDRRKKHAEPNTASSRNLCEQRQNCPIGDPFFRSPRSELPPPTHLLHSRRLLSLGMIKTHLQWHS